MIVIVIISVYIPDTIRSIGENAFFSCENLISVTISSDITDIGDNAFYDCFKLIEISLHKPSAISKMVGYTEDENNTSDDIAKIARKYPTRIGYLGYYALNVVIPSENSSKLNNENDEYIFYEDNDTVYLMGYRGVDTVLKLPNNYNGKNYSIYEYAFYNCSFIKKVTLGTGVDVIGECAFYGCTTLTDIKISDNVKSIGKWAFVDCIGLTSITIPDKVTSIELSAFYNCTGLKNVIIGDGVTNIDMYAFDNCTSIISMVIPDSVVNIGDYAFYNCNSMRDLTLSRNITSIGKCAFGFCGSLKSITYDGNVADWNAIKKGSSWDYDTDEYVVNCIDGKTTKS